MAGERRRGWRAVAVLSVLSVLSALLAAAVAVDRYDVGRPWLDERWNDLLGRTPARNPADIPPPSRLRLPPAPAPRPVADPVPPGRLDPVRVRLALAPYLSERDLGRHVLAAVAPLGGGRPALLSIRGRDEAIPASTTKLVTATAALLALGPQRRFTTTVVAAPRRPGRRRSAPPVVVLVGGGDPFLASRPPDGSAYPPRADVVTLARRTAAALGRGGVRRVEVGYDDSLFSGPSVNPRWEPDYVADGVVSPVSALWVDEGRDPTGHGHVADPPATAAAVFARALARAGVPVVGPPRPATAAPGGRMLAAVRSAPLADVVEQTLAVSDNDAAEVLLRQVGLAVEGKASFAAGQRGVRRMLARAGVDLGDDVLYDGSGLSRRNRLSPGTLLAVLRLAASPAFPALRPILTGLPVAGFTGSLADRYRRGGSAGRGWVRAKTGTLARVSSLAGITLDRRGVPMLFVLMADRIPRRDTHEAQRDLDEAAAALAGCSCSAR